MKVCHVITRMILGGAQENTLLTCRSLNERGYDVTLITGPPLGPEGQLLDKAKAEGYRVIVIDQMRRQVNPLMDYLAGRKLSRCLREIRPDIVHSHSSKAGILTRQVAAKVGGIRIVHTIHGLAFHPHQSRLLNRIYISLERRAAKVTDAIICVAESMKDQALAAGIGEKSQYTTIYSGMDVESFVNRPAGASSFREAMNLPENAILVTQVSRLAKLKGHEFILAGAERISDARVHFCFVGDGNYRRQILSAIARCGLAKKFHLTGLLDPDQIPAVMHASDILVHCSLHEGLARTIPQAMLAGKPVVSFDVDGAREVVDASTGILLKPQDVEGLTLAVETLASSEQLRRELGQAGKDRCEKIFDHNIMADQIEEVYRRVTQTDRLCDTG